MHCLDFSILGQKVNPDTKELFKRELVHWEWYAFWCILLLAGFSMGFVTSDLFVREIPPTIDDILRKDMEIVKLRQNLEDCHKLKL